MKKYISGKRNTFDNELVSIIDELPLWAAPFGLSLLDKIKIARRIKVLDIGCGTGFPLLEIAQRLGETSAVYGIDPWMEVNNRAQFKIAKHDIKNTSVIKGYAERLPFRDSFFDVIVSNNGINNVKDLNQTLYECSRVAKKGAQFLFTMNLDGTMMEFYNVLKDELELTNNLDAVENLNRHIYEKRRPLNEIRKLLRDNSFNVNEISENLFYLRFADASAMFKHSFIKNWFMDGWKRIVEPENPEIIFSRVEKRLNTYAEEKGELKLTVPFAVINSTRL
jgi:arsenite methyltransferase